MIEEPQFSANDLELAKIRIAQGVESTFKSSQKEKHSNEKCFLDFNAQLFFVARKIESNCFLFHLFFRTKMFLEVEAYLRSNRRLTDLTEAQNNVIIHSFFFIQIVTTTKRAVRKNKIY